MSCISKIRNCTTYTATEKRISEYIYAHREEIIYDTAQSLAEKAKVSAAAIIRFAKKLGYQGFTDLKLDLAADLKSYAGEDFFSETIKNHDSIEQIIKKQQACTMNMLEETYQLIHPPTLQKAVEILKHAKKIYLFGIGASGVCCLDFAQKLTRIGLEVIYYADNHMQMAASAHINTEDAALAISYSGNTREINAFMKQATQKGAETIAITQLSKSPLHKFARELLFVPHYEQEFRLGAISSRNASLVLTDLLYLGIISDDLDYYKNTLKYSREIIRMFYE